MNTPSCFCFLLTLSSTWNTLPPDIPTTLSGLYSPFQWDSPWTNSLMLPPSCNRYLPLLLYLLLSIYHRLIHSVFNFFNVYYLPSQECKLLKGGNWYLLSSLLYTYSACIEHELIQFLNELICNITIFLCLLL